MKSVGVLPDGYKEYYSIDLQKNKKMALVVNALAVIIAAVMVVPMCFLVPISTMFDMSDDLTMFLIRFGSMAALMILYMVLHELVHGIAMKICGTKKVKYGFTGLYAFAGSEDYYAKKPYVFIALAPVVLWGVVLGVVNFLVPLEWVWVIYMIQVINISGAAGDFFVTFKFSRFPDDILVKDHGVGMVVFSKHTAD